MWILDSPALPEVAQDTLDIGIPFTYLTTGEDFLPLCEVEGEATAVITIPPFTAYLTVELPGAEFITGVGDFTPAANPELPQPGEFTWNSDTRILTLYPSPTTPITPGLQLNIQGVGTDGGSLIPSVAPLPPAQIVPTDWVNPTLFTVFWNLPLVGTINWTRSLEQHPSGSLSLIVLRSGIHTVRSRFAKGQEIEFAGVGFSVANYSEKLLNTNEYPGGVYEVGISLTGKWNRPDYLKGVSLTGEALSGIPEPQYGDPDCQLAGNAGSSNNNKTATNPRELAARNRVSVELSGNDWEITIPKDTPRTATVNWLSEIQSRTRQNQSFLRLSSARAVQAKNVNSVSYWSYWIPEIEVSSQGDYVRGDGRFGYAVEYANIKVDGKFANPTKDKSEDTQGKKITSQEPQWREREVVRQTNVNGDPDPTAPPANSTSITSLDLNFDASGPTKSQEVTETVDGMIMRRTLRTWGFAYLARDIYQGENKAGEREYRANPNSWWFLIRKEVETFNYDPKTGYLLGSDKSGWQLVRFGTENPTEPESIIADESDDPIEKNRIKIYNFRYAPLYGATRYFLEQHLDYYNDIESPPYIIYKVCNRDGSSSYRYKHDPTYVPSMFASVEMTHSNSYMRMQHPDNNSEEAKEEDYIPKPDLTTGEETLNRRYLKILPSKNTSLKVAAFLGEREGGDRFVEYSSNFSASGPNFQNSAEDTKMTTSNGRPGAATRKPSLLERVEPESSNPNPTDKTTTAQLYEYRLLTQGHEITDPVQGSTSFPHAKTITAARNHAETDLKIRDAQESVNASVTIPFNSSIGEFDVIGIVTNFDSYSFRVLSVSNSVTIQGSENGVPILSAPGGTKLSLGINRNIPVRLEKIKLPQGPNNAKDDNKLTIINVIKKDVTLGSLLSVSIPTRRNW